MREFKIGDYIKIKEYKSKSMWYHDKPMKISKISKNMMNKTLLFIDLYDLNGKINDEIYNTWLNYNGIAAELVINITNIIRKEKLKNII
jgi:hypothetical protein